MGDVPEPTVNPSQPLVVSSTIRKEVDEMSREQFLQSKNEGNLDNTYSTPSASQNATGEVDSQTQQYRHSVHSAHQSYGHPPNSHLEGSRPIATNSSHIHIIREMTDSSYSVPAAHPQFRYSSTGFQPPMATHCFQAQDALSVPPLANAVYYPYSIPRYSPMYCSPFNLQYPPLAIPVAQLPSSQETYFYTPGYPHPYPENPSLATTTITPNTPRQQPQLYAPPPRWSPAQHPVAQYHCRHITNAFVPQAGPHPMQPSFSHPAPSAHKPPQQPSAVPFRYIRRHSHPSRNPRAKARPELLQLPHAGWAQLTRGDGQQPGGQTTTTNTATAPAWGIVDSPTADTASSSIQLDPFAYSPLWDGASSMQAAETPASSVPTVAIFGTNPVLPRGPPRKPKKSGHALWVGNLPPWTNIIELKDHFSRGATSEIESVFHISKSNCAFVNYRTDAACNEAMARFHDNRFKGVRLVCRLRRNSAAPPSPSGAITNHDRADQEVQGEGQVNTGTEAIEGAEVKKDDTRDKHKDRIFILKSLTVEDLDLSVTNSVWATQSHNEEVLNRAFETAENVYLIFSANKSGEYYGYARMTSRIPEGDADENDDHTNSDNPAMLQRMTTGSRLPKAILTPATVTAPVGRIIDDSARGTIFWEATVEELVDGDAADDKPEETDESMAGIKPWGKPFNVQWISTTKLPFFKTRGFRNSWNSNREVKIARDGTEVEEAVGKRLLQMFHHRSTPGELINRLSDSSASNQ